MASRDGFKQIIKQNTPKENIQSVWVKRIWKDILRSGNMANQSTRHKVEISPASEEAVGDCLTGLGKAFRLDTLKGIGSHCKFHKGESHV